MIYKFAIIFSIIFIIFVMYLVKKNKLDEKYSILWLIASVVIFIVALFPKIIVVIANKFNVYYPPTLMLLFSILVLGAYIIHISIVLTKQNKMIVKLTQELGILNEKIQKDENEKVNVNEKTNRKEILKEEYEMKYEKEHKTNKKRGKK